MILLEIETSPTICSMRSAFSAALWLLTLFTMSPRSDARIIELSFPTQVSDTIIKTADEEKTKHDMTNDIVPKLEVSILENSDVKENLQHGNETAPSRQKRNVLLVRDLKYSSLKK